MLGSAGGGCQMKPTIEPTRGESSAHASSKGARSVIRAGAEEKKTPRVKPALGKVGQLVLAQICNGKLR